MGGGEGGAGRPGGRERILGRVRAALEGREALPHPGGLPRGPDRGAGADGAGAAAFAASFAASGGETVVLESPARARAWVAGFAKAFGSAVVSPDVPPHLRPSLPEAEPAEAGLGVSLALGAAAATGSLVLASRHGRALQLLPPVHLVWVDARTVAGTLDEALGAARAAGPLPATLALHSGPSKSADIGRIVVTGVHGPGRVVAAVVQGWDEEG